MKTKTLILVGGIFAAALMAASPSVMAQVQTTGTPGSPSATTTVDGKQLPPPPPKFGGLIKETVSNIKSKTLLEFTIVREPGNDRIKLTQQNKGKK